MALWSLFVGSMLLFGFLVVQDPSWLSLGSILEGLSLDFGRFWDPFWKFLVMIWVPCALQFWYFFVVFSKFLAVLGCFWQVLSFPNPESAVFDRNPAVSERLPPGLF